jgi:hypothetical protein
MIEISDTDPMANKVYIKNVGWRMVRGRVDEYIILKGKKHLLKDIRTNWRRRK